MKTSEECGVTMTVYFLISESSELKKKMDKVCRLYKISSKSLVMWAFRSFLSSGKKFEDIVLTKDEYMENLYSIRHRDDCMNCPVQVSLKEAARIQSFCKRNPLGFAAFTAIKLAIVSRHVDSLLESHRNDFLEDKDVLASASLSDTLLEKHGQDGRSAFYKQITMMMSFDSYKKIMTAAEMHKVSYASFVRNLAVYYVNNNTQALFSRDFDDGKEKFKRMSIYFRSEDYENIKEFAARNNMKMSPALIGIVFDSINRMKLPEVA